MRLKLIIKRCKKRCKNRRKRKIKPSRIAADFAQTDLQESQSQHEVPAPRQQSSEISLYDFDQSKSSLQNTPRPARQDNVEGLTRKANELLSPSQQIVQSHRVGIQMTGKGKLISTKARNHTSQNNQSFDDDDSYGKEEERKVPKKLRQVPKVSQPMPSEEATVQKLSEVRNWIPNSNSQPAQHFQPSTMSTHKVTDVLDRSSEQQSIKNSQKRLNKAAAFSSVPESRNFDKIQARSDENLRFFKSNLKSFANKYPNKNLPTAKNSNNRIEDEGMKAPRAHIAAQLESETPQFGFARDSGFNQEMRNHLAQRQLERQSAVDEVRRANEIATNLYGKNHRYLKFWEKKD